MGTLATKNALVDLSGGYYAYWTDGTTEGRATVAVLLGSTDAAASAAAFASLDSTPIGATTPSTGSFTDLTATGTVSLGGVLDDLITLGAAAADGEFIVATGAGAFAYESGATARASLGLVIGTDVQAYDADLAEIAALDPTANQMIYAGAGGTWATTSLTVFARTILDDANAASVRSTIGVDPAGTDNSTDVTLAGAYNYLTLAGQEITLAQIDLTTDVTGALPIANAAFTDQNVLTTSSPTFAELTVASDLTLSSGDLTVNGLSTFDRTDAVSAVFQRSGGTDANTALQIAQSSRDWYIGASSAGGFALKLNSADLSSGNTIYWDTNGNTILGATSTSNNAQLYNRQSTAVSSSTYHQYNFITQTTAATGIKAASYNQLDIDHTSGTVAEGRGVVGRVDGNGSGGTTTTATAVHAIVQAATGHTITNGYGVRIPAFGGSGTITNGWGIYQEGASENNYFAGDLRISTTSATSHGQEVLRVSGTAGARLANIHRGDSGAAWLHFTNTTTGTTTNDGFNIGIEADESAIIKNDESTPMRFYTASTERFRVAADAYALGVGTTDVESWSASYTAIELGDGGAIMAGRAVSRGEMYLMGNAYYDGSYKYKNTNEASQFIIYDGYFIWDTAASGTADTTISWSERMRLTNGGMLLVGDTANANMTVGLTLAQGANDDEILAFKSSDISHGVTGATETDTYGYALKLSSGNGGLSLFGVTESQIAARLSGIYTTTATGKTTGTGAAVEVAGLEKSGTGTTTTLTSDQNVFGVRGSEMLFIVDAEGDFHYNGADGGAFDVYEDAHLVRAFANATSKETVRTAHDDWVQYNEQTLVDIGVLGAPVSEGGLINGAQLQRVHTGAIWQNYMAISDTGSRVDQLEAELAETKGRLAIAESKLLQLNA